MSVSARCAAAALLLTCAGAAWPAGAARGRECVCDCGGDGSVSIEELVLAVGVALAQEPAASCTAADGNGDGRVTIDELVTAVNDALGGCPSPPTATAIASPTDTVPEFFGVRDVANRFTYVEYATHEYEIYDLVADPWQLDNKADDPSYAATRARLAARTHELMR